MAIHGHNDMEYEALYRRNIELTHQLEHLSMLREIGLAISASLEMSETLPIIAHVVQGSLEVRRFSLYQLEEDGSIFRPIIAKYGDDLISPERLEEESVARRGSRLGEALDTRSVVLVETPQGGAAYVPLLAKQEALGVMLLEDRRDGLPFGKEDAVLFQQLGSQIALALHNAHLYALAVTDGLTRLYVRRYFDLRIEEEFAQARRYHRLFSILLFDIDHFKQFNDSHGHQTGDLVLQQFSALLRRNTRQSDICCRYGGEEITIILPETPMTDAALLANKLCAMVREHFFSGSNDQPLKVTTSIGVAGYRPEYARAHEMVAAADAALYTAKQNGRNRVELAV